MHTHYSVDANENQTNHTNDNNSSNKLGALIEDTIQMNSNQRESNSMGSI